MVTTRGECEGDMQENKGENKGRRWSGILTTIAIEMIHSIVVVVVVARARALYLESRGRPPHAHHRHRRGGGVSWQHQRQTRPRTQPQPCQARLVAAVDATAAAAGFCGSSGMDMGGVVRDSTDGDPHHPTVEVVILVAFNVPLSV